MQALIDGRVADFDKTQATQKAKKLRGKGWEKRFRGQDFQGEGVDIIIAAQDHRQRKHKLKPWEVSLRKGSYATALDEVLAQPQLSATITLLTALRHRSALRTALSGRDEVSLVPVFKWVCTYISDPRYVGLCVDVGVLVLDLYAEFMGESREVDGLRKRLHAAVRREVGRCQMAWQTEGMLGLVMEGGEG